MKSNKTIEEAVIAQKRGDLLTIVFNRPAERNPLSISTLELIRETLGAARRDDRIKTIIFTGTEDVFASGANLREIATITGETAGEFAARGQSLMNEITALTPTTIAAVNGFCFGGALDLALACDVRIAAPGAVFCHPGTSLGIITGWGGTQRLPRLIGEARALEIFLTAKRVEADEALQIGLVDRIAANPLADALANYGVE